MSAARVMSADWWFEDRAEAWLARHLTAVSPERENQVWTPFSVRFTARITLLAATLLVLAFQIAITVVAAVNDAYDLTMFTLWSFTMLTAFLVVLVAALIIERALFTLLVLFGLPLVLGNVVFVAVTIIVIIANNSAVYTDGSTCEQPPPADPISMSNLHTGDWVLHGWPVFAMFLVLIAGGQYFARRVVIPSLRSFKPVWQWLYFLYWECVSLVPLAIYQSIWDVDKKYPTSFTTAERTLIMLAILWVWMTALWAVFTAEYSPDQMDVRAMPHIEDLAEGRLWGTATPSTAHHELVISRPIADVAASVQL